MPSINASSMYTNRTSELQLRSLSQRDATKFNATLFEISDQQSRDKDYEKGLEWIRTYIGSLQAKLNSTIEELNGLYETLLTDTMYKRADTKDTAKVMNGVEFALPDGCMPDKKITPVLKYVRNYQYNPLYGSRGVDINNQFLGNANSTLSSSRVNYEDTSALHHELGTSAFGTLNYLWNWDVDRINASYATSLDQYVGEDGILYVAPGNSAINGTTILADPALAVIGDSNQIQVNVTALQPNRGVFFPGTELDPTTVDHVLKETFESDAALNTVNGAKDDCKWTQTYSNPFDRNLNQMSDYLQWGIAHNRGAEGSTSSVHFGDPTHQNYLYEYYVVKDNVEKDTVDDWPVQPNPSPFLQPTPPNGLIDQPVFPDQDYVNVSGSQKSFIENSQAGNSPGLVAGDRSDANTFSYAATSTDHFNQESNADERDDGDLVVNITSNSNGQITTTTYTTPGGVSAKWRRSTDANQIGVAYSGTDSYYFGNRTGSSYGADPNALSPVADTYTVTMEWHGEGEYYYVDVLGIPSLVTEYEPDFDLHVYNEFGTEMPGTIGNTPVHYTDNHTLNSFSTDLTNDGTEIHTLSGASGKRFIKIELKDTDGWLAPIQTYHVEAKLTPVGRNAGNAVNITNGGEIPMVPLTIGLDWEDSWVPHPEVGNRDWWGNGYYGGPGATFIQGNDRVVSNSSGVSGFQVDYFNPYRPRGIMTRAVDLTKMSGPDGGDGTGLGFERLELRYKQNYTTESQNTSMDQKIIQESDNNGSAWTDILRDSRITQSDTPRPATDGLETVNGLVWESKKVNLDNADWGTTAKEVAFKFEALDQYYNETKGWNVDNIEVVGRGNSKGELISPKMDLSKYTTAGLSFDSRFGTGQSTGAGVTKPATGNDDTTKDPGDIGSIYYSIDGGTTWKIVPPTGSTSTVKLGREVDSLGTVVNAQGSAADAGWVNNTLDLACAAGQSDVRVKFVFQTNADNNEGDGWNIDNVDVFGKKSAATDFYMYKQNLDEAFVSGTTSTAEKTNTNRPNISFDPRGSNSLGRYDVNNNRINITNTDTPMFSNTLLTYVEQSNNTYNPLITTKADTIAAWVGQDNGPLLVVDKYGTITYTTDTNFTPDSLGRLFNSEGKMYIDEAMAINLGLSVGVEPTRSEIGSKTTGWVNYDVGDEGLKFVAGTCFDEGLDPSTGLGTSYQHMSVYAKNTVFSNGGGAASMTIDADDSAYLYVNGTKILPTAATAGTNPKTFNFSLVDGVNTIAIQQTEATGPDEHIKVTASTVPGVTTTNPLAMNDKWAVSLYTGGYKVVPTTKGPGTVTVTDGSSSVSGSGTAFLTTYQVGSTILIGGEQRVITNIASNTSMTVAAPWTANWTNKEYTAADVPAELGFSSSMAGNVSITSGSNVVKGSGTNFYENFSVGNTITIDGQTRTITAVGSPLAGTSTVAAGSSIVKGTGTAYFTDFKPGDLITVGGETRTVAAVDPFLTGTATALSGSNLVMGGGTNFVNDYAVGSKITIGGETMTVAAIDPNLTGTVTNSANSKLVTGTGVQFLTDYLPGQSITIGGQTKVIDMLGTQCVGNVTIDSANLAHIIGNATTFTSDYTVGSKIMIGNEARTVQSIASDGSLFVTAAFSKTATNSLYSKNPNTTLTVRDAFTSAHTGSTYSRDPKTALTVTSNFTINHNDSLYSRDPNGYLTVTEAFTSAHTSASYTNPNTSLVVNSAFTSTKSGATYQGIENNLLQSDRQEVFGQQIAEKKAVQVQFNNFDKAGAGILSNIQSIEVVATGEPTVQSYATAEYSTKKQTDQGTMITRLDHGFKNGVAQDGTAKDSFNFSPTSNLGYITDNYGKANVTLLMDNSEALTRDATLLIKVKYTEDTNMDGIIDATEAANVKIKYIGQEDGRDTTYYQGVGDVKVANASTAIVGTNTTFKDNFQVGQTIKIGTETRTISTITDDTHMTVTSPFSSAHDTYTNTAEHYYVSPMSNGNVNNGNIINRFAYQGGTGVIKSNVNDSYANQVYATSLTASKGRSGGSEVDGSQNILTKRIKQIVDDPLFQEMLRFGLLDNIFIAATVSDNRGDQIVGKLILDWDWRRRRVNVNQGSFSAIFKA
jgi:hypothetical protein